MDQIGLELAAREIGTILTPGYRPPPNYFGYGQSVPWLPFYPAINTAIIDAMVRDYQVKLACSMKIVPIMKPKFSITGDPEVIEFVKSELRSIWTQCITDIATAMWYTRFGCEMVYKRGDDGMIRFSRMMPFHPRDFRILSRDGQIAGIRIIASHDSDVDGTNLTTTDGFGNIGASSSNNFGMKQKPIWNPKCFCYVHDRKFGSFDGTSELEGAFQPWMDKVKEGGANESRSLWYYKCAFDSGMIFHPDGTNDDPDHPGQKIPYRDYALKVGESIRNGSVVAVPSAVGADGQRAWDWVRPEMNEGGEVLLNYVDHLDGKINKGAGIPDDVIERVSGGGTGGGYGRTIPFIAFLEAGTPTVRKMTAELTRQTLIPEAQLNFGYERGKDWEITECGVNVDEFLGEDDGTGGAGGEGAGLPGDGDNDGVSNEAAINNGYGGNGGGNGLPAKGVGQQQQNRMNQFSQVMERVDRLADSAKASDQQRKQMRMAAVADFHSRSSVTFVDGDGGRLAGRSGKNGKRASAAVAVQLSQSDHWQNQHRDEHGRFAGWSAGHAVTHSVNLPKSREKLHPNDAMNAAREMGYLIDSCGHDEECGETIYKLLNVRGEKRDMTVKDLRDLAYGGELFQMGQRSFGFDESEHPRDKSGEFTSKGNASSGSGKGSGGPGGIADEPFQLKRERSTKFVPKNSSGQQTGLFGANKTTHSPADEGVKKQAESLPGQKTIEDAVLIGNGSTGDVSRVGDKVYKNASETESKIYSKIGGVNGVSIGETENGKIVTPFYPHVVSVDTVEIKKRRNLSAVVKPNISRIVSAVTELSRIGYDYNDPIQIGLDRDRKSHLIDFSNASKVDDEDAIVANLGHLSSFLSQFGLERHSAGVSRISHLWSYVSDSEVRDFDSDSEESKDAGKIASSLSGKPRYAYYSFNAREIKGLPQSEYRDGIKAVFSETPLSDDVMSQWELHPAVHESKKIRQFSQSGSPQSGHWITIGGKKGSGDSGGCRVFISRSGKILKGPVALKGESLKSLSDPESKDRRQSRAAHAKAHNITAREFSDDDARKFGSKPHVTAHMHAREEARMAGVATHDVLQNMIAAHRQRIEFHQSRETAKSRARDLAGKNAGNLAKIENSYRDHSSVPGFDTVARTVAMEHPELGLDPDDSDTAAAVWELIREGKSEEPKLHDRETARQAAEWVMHAKKSNRAIKSDHDAKEYGDDDLSFDFGANASESADDEDSF